MNRLNYKHENHKFGTSDNLSQYAIYDDLINDLDDDNEDSLNLFEEYLNRDDDIKDLMEEHEELTDKEILESNNINNEGYESDDNLNNNDSKKIVNTDDIKLNNLNYLVKIS